MWLFSTSGERAFWDVTYEPGDILVFGNESSGLPQGILEPNRERCLVIPMEPSLRSLNLSNAVAVALYEALRQLSVRLLSGRPERKD
jgi:tRNA (cytidine/uridine-2'-O-)-methyltransferase